MRPQFDVDLEFFDGFASLDGFELLDGFNSTASSDLNFDSFAGLCDLRSMVSRVLQVYATSLSMDDHDSMRFHSQFSIFNDPLDPDRRQFLGSPVQSLRGVRHIVGRAN